mgnify:CR=1 FL=1
MYGDMSHHNLCRNNGWLSLRDNTTSLRERHQHSTTDDFKQRECSFTKCHKPFRKTSEFNQALQIQLEEQSTQIVDLKSCLESQKLDQDMQKLQLGQFNLILGTCDSEIETFALPSENYK